METQIIKSEAPISVIPVAQQIVNWQSLNANVGPSMLVPSRSLSRIGVEPDDPIALTMALLSIDNLEQTINDPFKCLNTLAHGYLAFLVVTGVPAPDYGVFRINQSKVFADEESTQTLMSGTIADWYLTTLLGSQSSVPYAIRYTANLIHAYMLRTGLRKLYGDCTRVALPDGTYTIERS